MKKREWSLVALAAALLAVILLLPGLAVRLGEHSLLKEVRTTEADLMAFAQVENTTLLRRMSIMASPGSAYTSLDRQEVGSRFGEPQLLLERSMEELVGLFPDAYHLEQLVRGAEVRFACYVEPFSKETLVLALCEFELDDALLTVGLDVSAKKIVTLELTGWSGAQLSQEGIYANPAYGTVVKTLEMDGDGETWFRLWADYWGLTLASAREGKSDYLFSAQLADPTEPREEIVYERTLLRELATLCPTADAAENQ